MPFESETQRRAMYAAAAGKSTLGIPPSVGEKFIKHGEDAIPPEPTPLSTPAIDGLLETVKKINDEAPDRKAAGIMLLTSDNETLLLRRAQSCDFPGTFTIPGGHQEEDETLEECARRETLEETGFNYEGPLELLRDDGHFTTYIARAIEKFDVTICDESTGYVWSHPDESPRPLHPALEVTFRIAGAKTEHDIAELMREGLMPSPQIYANICLLAIRITGTGLAFRSSIGEHVWRDPSLYLNEDFLKRCNGLTVVMDHPETAVLDSKEFKNRAIGSIMLPYIQGDEVWGIAKLYDQESVDEILEGEISTSPSVVFDNAAGNITLTTENGDPLLIEGVPFLLDHIAIVTKARGSKGVWDKGGEAAGVLLNNQEVSDMTDNTNTPAADAHGEKLDAILSAVGTLATRVDSMEKNLPAPPLVTAADKKRKDAAGGKEELPAGEIKPDDDDDDDDKKRKDAAGGKEELPAGEIKPDDDDDAKKDDDVKKDEEEEEMAAKKADDEAAMYADCQAKADSVLASFGKSASRPLQGETLMSYRKRLLRGLQGYSDSYKGINLGSIKDEALLSLAEKQIFADAYAMAKAPQMFAADQLVEVHEKDRAGRTITKFRGSMSAWLDDFKVPALRVKEFHLSNNQR